MTEINVNASEVSRAIREMEARADIEAENARAALIAKSDETAAKGKRKSQLIFYDGDFNQSSAAHFGMRNMSKVYHTTRESQYFRGITKTTSITDFYVNEAYKPDEEKPWHCDANHYCVVKFFNAGSTFASFNTEDEAKAFANEIGLVQSIVTDMLRNRGEQQ